MFDIKLDRVSKRYFIQAGTRGRQSFYWTEFSFLGKGPREVWALRDVSFQVEGGESLGIIGNNGAGKSTILKLLSSITAPTAGEITIRGRLSALVEVSSGFHPELTGRENIFLNGSMLGMSRSEIARKVESIVEFAGVQEFLDVPVKRYSSGMYVRLGFSIAAHLDADIILLDEVLAVGDIAFQAKCLDRIGQLREAGRTLILISHDLAAIQRLCDRALLLQHGRVVLTGSPRSVIDHYQQMAFAGEKFEEGRESAQHRSAQCLSVSFTSADPQMPVRTGYPMFTRLAYRATEAIDQVVFNVLIYWPSGYLCAQLTTAVSESHLRVPRGSGMIEFHCPVLEVQPGLYRVDISIESNGQYIDRQQRCSLLRVDPGKMVLGDFYINSSWRICGSPAESLRAENDQGLGDHPKPAIHDHPKTGQH
jgi:ABC-type polysaccharide/polyol phosphate transport system ATPase subunit